MSQCSRVLEVLRDGRPHSIQEIHERAGTMRLNSRISDLRALGYFIEYFRKDGLHTYQLRAVREGEVAADAHSVDSASPLGLSSAEQSNPDVGVGATSEAGPGPLPDETPGQGQSQKQLSVFEAAA